MLLFSYYRVQRLVVHLICDSCVLVVLRELGRIFKNGAEQIPVNGSSSMTMPAFGILSRQTSAASKVLSSISSPRSALS